MSKRMLQRGRYPKVPQTQQQPQQQSESHLNHQWPTLPPPQQQAGVTHPTTDVNFYNTQQSHIQNQSTVQNGQPVLSSGNWESPEATSRPQRSLLPPHAASLPRPTPVLAESGWQIDTTYPPSQANQNDPWNWNIENNERNQSQQYQTWQGSDSWKGHQQQQPHSSSIEASLEHPQHYTQQIQHQENAGTTQSYFPMQENVNTTGQSTLQQSWRYSTPEQPLQQHRSDEQRIQDTWNYEALQPQSYSADQYSWSNSIYTSDNWYHQQQQQHTKVQPPHELQHSSGQPNINQSWDVQEWEQWPTNTSQDSQQQKFHPFLDKHSSSVAIPNTSSESEVRFAESAKNTNLPADADATKDINSRSTQNIITSDIINDNVQNHPFISSDTTETYNAQEESAVHTTVLQDSDGGGLSAFFSNDVQDQVTSSETVNTCKNLAQADSFSQEGTASSIQEESISSSVECCEHDQNSSSDSEVDTTVRDKSTETLEENSVQKRSEFLQSEEDGVAQHAIKALTLDSESCLEEPVNQEVPEPPPESVLNPQLHSTWAHQTATQQRGIEYKDEHVRTTTEEPVNQQVPENGTGALVQEERISSPQHDRVIIRAREGSPFKPPSKQSSIRGLVVQKEASPEAAPAPSLSSESTAQDANLETVPDNLERLPDADVVTGEQQQQHYSSWHNALHRHHGREQYNNSPSTTLWDSPDIPSVTLAPAAPPFPPSPTHNPPDKSNEGSAFKEVPQNDTCSQSALRQSPLGREELTYPIPSLQGTPLRKNKDQGVVPAHDIPCPPPPPAIALELLQKTSLQGPDYIPQLIKPSKTISPVPEEPVSEQQSSDPPAVKTDVLTEMASATTASFQPHQTLPPSSNLSMENARNRRDVLPPVKDREYLPKADVTKESSKDPNVYIDRRNAFSGQRPKEEGYQATQDTSEWWGKDNQKGSAFEEVPRGNQRGSTFEEVPRVNNQRGSALEEVSRVNNQRGSAFEEASRRSNQRFEEAPKGNQRGSEFEEAPRGSNQQFEEVPRGNQRGSEFEDAPRGSNQRFEEAPRGSNQRGSEFEESPRGSNQRFEEAPRGSNQRGSAFEEAPSGSNQRGSTFEEAPGGNQRGTVFEEVPRGSNQRFEEAPRGNNQRGSAFEEIPRGNHRKGSAFEEVRRGNMSFSSNADGSPLRSNRTEHPEHWDRRQDPKYQYEDYRYAGYNDRSYYIEQDRSRPSSRTSLNDYADGHERYLRERDYSRHYYPERESTPSRLSESDIPSKQRERPPDHYESDSYDERYHRGYQRDDYYNRHRNYTGYGYDSYRQDSNPYYSYYNPYGYGYNSYNYGFYDEMYRYNKHIEEQYHQYHSAYAADYEKLSVHSGRSSANEDFHKNSNSLKYSRDTDQSSFGGSEYSAYNQQYIGYGEESIEPPSRPATDQEVITQPAARLTPAKFSTPHCIASFSQSGLLIKVIPTQTISTHPLAVEIHSLQQILEDSTYRELKQYPGPLVRGKTHKNDLVQFCQKKIQEVKEKPEIPDRDSCILLWELLILLLRQNGSVAGSDIAELLLKDHEVLRPPVLLPRLAADTPQSEGVLPDLTDPAAHSSGDTPSPDEGIVVSQDKSVLNSQAISTEKVTRKFREFLLFGHKKDALEWAMKHTLWGHALFLASKMDSRTYANVMIRFANSLALNDPLQTLYQLMSGRQPSAVTCVVDEKWGDWRPHLAMVLSNPSTRPEVDARSITTLGDTLVSRGCLYAGHFCYLMAQVEFGAYSSKSSKIVLLGSNHLNVFEEFATNEAIQCSEIYEYAQSLANPDYILPHLQAYKFIYATRLAEYGFYEEALHYLEILSGSLQKLHAVFPQGLLNQVYKLATTLKYHDPHFTQGPGEFEELGDPVWLLNLQNHKKEMDALSDYETDEDDEEDEEEEEDSRQPASHTGRTDHPNVSSASVPPTDVKEPLAYAPYENMGYQPNTYNQQVETQKYYNQEENYQGYAWTGQEGGIQQNVNNHILNEQDTTDYGHSQQFVAQGQTNTTHWAVGSEQKPDDYRNNELHVHGISQPPPSTDSYDYYGASTQMGHSHRQQLRDRQDSVGSDSTYRDRRDSTLSAGSGHMKIHSGSSTSTSLPTQPPPRKNVEDPKNTEKKADKPKSSGGWLNGIFSRILPKAPNQMILPDDKNPTIIWDSVKQKWVNTEDDENDDGGKSMAPPTDMELMEKIPQYDNQSNSSLGISHNRFQRTKSKGMRQNYVDVLNPRSIKTNAVPPPEVLFPSVDTSVPSETKFFAPSSVSDHEERPPDYISSGQPPGVPPAEDEHSTVAAQMPLMFDPAEFASSRINTESHRSGSNVLNRRAYPT